MGVLESKKEDDCLKIEKIIKKVTTETGQVLYEVKWTGCLETTLEPLSTFDKSMEMLEGFEGMEITIQEASAGVSGIGVSESIVGQGGQFGLLKPKTRWIQRYFTEQKEEVSMQY